jgi:hypothetical protein
VKVGFAFLNTPPLPVSDFDPQALCFALVSSVTKHLQKCDV